MSVLEQLTEEEQDPQLEEVKAYFYAQHQRNRTESPGDIETRKAALRRHLEVVRNAIWYGGYDLERVDIFMADEGFVLDPQGRRDARPTTRRFRDDATLHSTEEGGRRFAWAVWVVSKTPSTPTVVFEDAETGELGVHSYIGSDFDFHENEGHLLGLVESHLGTIFYPGSNTQQCPEDPSHRYQVVPQE